MIISFKNHENHRAYALVYQEKTIKKALLTFF